MIHRQGISPKGVVSLARTHTRVHKVLDKVSHLTLQVLRNNSHLSLEVIGNDLPQACMALGKDSHPSSQRPGKGLKPEPTSRKQGFTMRLHGLMQGLAPEPARFYRQGLTPGPMEGPIPYLSCLYTFDAPLIGTRIGLFCFWNNEAVWMAHSIRLWRETSQLGYWVQILIGRMFVIKVVHIQCSKLFKLLECAVVSMTLCTIKNPNLFDKRRA